MPAIAKLLSAHARVAPVLAFLVVIAACSDESVTAPGSNPGTMGQFNATVAGAVHSSLTGAAAIVPIAATVVDNVHVPPGAILGLLDKSTQAVVAFQWTGSSTVAPGTYAIEASSTSFALVFDTGTGAAGSTFDGTSGSVVITSVTNGVAVGTFNATATAQDTGAQVTVSGSFSAPTIVPSNWP